MTTALDDLRGIQMIASRCPFDWRRSMTGCVTAGFDHALFAEHLKGETS